MGAWLEVDRQGLAKLLQRRGKHFIIAELLQNAWDEPGVRNVAMSVSRVPSTPWVDIKVVDDAQDGFRNLAHAYTLFAESSKKANPDQRGRFNLGDKLILALAEEASIISTTGGYRFDRDGRHRLRSRTDRGSCISIRLRMNDDELEQCHSFTRRLLPPHDISTLYNGEAIEPRPIVHAYDASLATEIADADGVLRPATRTTQVRLHAPLGDGKCWLYEMGIPVVELLDLPYNVDVQQKVPLNFERDSVSASYLRELFRSILDQTHGELDPAHAASQWVRMAMSSSRVSQNAVRRVVALRFGDKAVAYDPTDPEANKRATADGYTVVHGGSMGAEEWDNVRRSRALPPAGKITPSPKPYGEGGRPLHLIDEGRWTPGMRAMAEFCRDLADRLMPGRHPSGITVRYTSDRDWPFNATYGEGVLTLNLGRLGRQWPDRGPTERAVALLIHEFGHEYSPDHLSSDYHDALCMLGARAALLGVPEFMAPALQQQQGASSPSP